MNPIELITALLEGGMTELEIARATGTTQATINRIKRGTISRPNYEIVGALQRLHGEKASPASRDGVAA